ncbi:hypothetical protein CHU98_g181 [Xylaria longipes]|nr:hypothetical protein CHU98_g181 [Xylaria longipes]
MLDSRVSDSLPGSYYAPLAEEFHRHVTRVPQGATDRFKYAVNLATQSLSPLPQAWFWHGSYTRWTRLYDIFGWRTVWACQANTGMERRLAELTPTIQQMYPRMIANSPTTTRASLLTKISVSPAVRRCPVLATAMDPPLEPFWQNTELLSHSDRYPILIYTPPAIYSVGPSAAQSARIQGPGQQLSDPL